MDLEDLLDICEVIALQRYISCGGSAGVIVLRLIWMIASSSDFAYIE